MEESLTYGRRVEFYGAASQVIPVLFLAMVFESRLLARRPESFDPSDPRLKLRLTYEPGDPMLSKPARPLYRIYAVTALAVGEIAALVGLDRGVRGDILDALIWLALLIGVLGVTVPLIRRQWGYLEDYWARIRDPTRPFSWVWQLLLFVVPMAFFTFMWIVRFP